MTRLLDTHFAHKSPGDATSPRVWAKGWGDKRVADECRVTVGNVVRLRRRGFGETQKKVTKKVGATDAKTQQMLLQVLDLIDRLQERVTRLEAAVGSNAGPDLRNHAAHGVA